MAITHMIPPREKDLGGFSVRRILPYAKQRMVGPWIFFDHMGPANFPAGEGIDVRPHPHINLATVTYLFEGEILHRDSVGSEQTIRPGDINLMVAGKGITHSERESDEVRNLDHTMHGLQLWHALPESQEETEPAFYHYPSAQIPSVKAGEVTVRVMMGSAYGVTSPVKTFANTLYLEAHMQDGQQLVLPAAQEAALYVVSGSATCEGESVETYHMMTMEHCEGMKVIAQGDTRIALIGGEPIGKRYIDWNFVSSDKERIEKAKADWRAGRFPKVPGDDKEFIPLPKE